MDEGAAAGHRRQGKEPAGVAAAGSGKTAVLVERIVRMVTDPDHPVDIDRLLVMTFTNAAAAEMRVADRGRPGKAAGGGARGTGTWSARPA